jgi:hypothetical protein
MTAAPAGAHKADAENPPIVIDEEPITPPPGTPELPPVDLSVPEGVVEVKRPAATAKEKKVADPAGQVSEQTKTVRKAAVKNDILALDKNGADKIDKSKLPVSVSVGDVVASVKEYAGNVVLELSLTGWVGDVPFKVLASDIPKIEQVFAELRKQLA